MGSNHAARPPPPPQISPVGQLPQLAIVPPQPSPDGPQKTFSWTHVNGTHAVDVPHLFGFPPPPQLPASQPPQSSVPPHPFP